MDQEAEENGTPNVVQIDKKAFVEAFLEADEKSHGKWRLAKVIPVASVVSVLVSIALGGMWVQSISDKVDSVQRAEAHDAALIDGQTQTFGKIASDSAEINVRLATVETEVKDIVDGVKRIEDRQGGDPPGK